MTHSLQILDYIKTRPQTTTTDIMHQFGLTHDAATKHLQRLHKATLIRRPQHGVYTPRTTDHLYAEE